MDFKIFDLKNRRIDENGDEYLDLTQHTFTYQYKSSIKAIYRVEADTEMRADLISIKFFGTEIYADAICKVNGIFNPFSIEEGLIIVIPDINAAKNYKKPDDIIFNNTPDVNVNEIRAQFIDKDRMSKQDKNRIDRLLNKSKKLKNPTIPLPPNMKNNNSSLNDKNDSIIKLANK